MAEAAIQERLIAGIMSALLSGFPLDKHLKKSTLGFKRYTSEGEAERVIVSDGELNFNFTSAYLPGTKWPLGHNFTLGGREISYAGVHLNGYITDVQILARVMTLEEMRDYTLCKKVSHLKEQIF